MASVVLRSYHSSPNEHVVKFAPKPVSRRAAASWSVGQWRYRPARLTRCCARILFVGNAANRLDSANCRPLHPATPCPCVAWASKLMRAPPPAHLPQPRARHWSSLTRLTLLRLSLLPPTSPAPCVHAHRLRLSPARQHHLASPSRILPHPLAMHITIPAVTRPS